MTGSEIEPVNHDAQDGLPAEWGTTAAEKIVNTLRELSKPDEDAGDLELTLATVCMGLERALGEQIGEQQESGQLDEFVLALTRFLALHRSDDAHQLVVVELPPYTVHGELAHGRQGRAKVNLPPGTRLKLLDDAIEAAAVAKSPL
jgi:hypothetical protein